MQCDLFDPVKIAVEHIDTPDDQVLDDQIIVDATRVLEVGDRVDA